MNEEMVIAGFGGQGVLSMGKILAYAGVIQDLEVSWMPSYGPEMRGGTANVTVILSDTQISSPVLKKYDTVVALNQQSLDKFEGEVKPGGTLLYDPNGISSPPTRTDINIYTIDATGQAIKVGNPKVFNMAVLGALLKIKQVVNIENVMKSLKASLPERLHSLLPKNRQAFELGMQSVIQVGFC